MDAYLKSVWYAAFLRGQGVHTMRCVCGTRQRGRRNREIAFLEGKPVWIPMLPRTQQNNWAGPVLEQEQVFA